VCTRLRLPAAPEAPRQPPIQILSWQNVA